jgi:FkbM family methyltransferase
MKQEIRQAKKVLEFVWTHPANAQARPRGIARALAFQVRGRMGRRSQTTVGNSARMWVELHSTAASKALYANPPDWREMQAWRLMLKPGDLFVDAGCNVGTYALWAADCGADVVAVEPSPEAFAQLKENIALNEFSIETHHCALADQPGTLKLSQGKGTTNHLILGAAGLGIEVQVDTLDNLLGNRRAAGVKIDVEGAERLVLEGARRALSSRRIEALQIEWNGLSQDVLGESRSPIVEILKGYGYQMCRPDATGLLRSVTAPGDSTDDLFALVQGHPFLLEAA